MAKKVKQVFVQESQLRKSTRPRPTSPRSLHIDPRSPSTRRQRVCSTAWRPAYAVAAASCRWARVLVLVAASARWRGGRRVRFRPVATTRTPLVAALPHLTRSCPRRREEENRQGARHDRVPQVSRQRQCINQIVASPLVVVKIRAHRSARSRTGARPRRRRSSSTRPRSPRSRHRSSSSSSRRRSATPCSRPATAPRA